MPDHPPALPPLDWVHAFEAAGRGGSFTAAAQELGLTQAAVSQRIGHLERRLGCRLFHRQPRGVRLTVEGEALLPQVEAAMEQLRQALDDQFGAGPRLLRLTASTSVTELWLAPRLGRLDPRARIEIAFSTMVVSADFADQTGMLEARYGCGPWPDRRCARLFVEHLAPVAAPALTARGGDWRDWPRLGLSGPRPGWRDWARQTGHPEGPPPVARFDSFTSALAAARAGAGVLLASLPLAEPDLASGALLRLEAPDLRPEASYWLVAQPAAVSPRQWQALRDGFCRGQHG